MSSYNAAPFIDRVPTYDELNWPALEAFRNLGGSASIAEHLSQLIEDKGVPEAISAIPHGETGRSELEYRLAWARTALRRCGYVENSARGIWSLTEAGEHASQDDLKLKINELRSADHKKYLKRTQVAPIGHLEKPSPLMRWSASLALAVSGGDDGGTAGFL